MLRLTVGCNAFYPNKTNFSNILILSLSDLPNRVLTDKMVEKYKKGIGYYLIPNMTLTDNELLSAYLSDISSCLIIDDSLMYSNYQWELKKIFEKFETSTDTVKTIIVGDGYTDIPDYMFTDFKNVNRVDLPRTIKSIGKHSFPFELTKENTSVGNVFSDRYGKSDLKYLVNECVDHYTIRHLGRIEYKVFEGIEIIPHSDIYVKNILETICSNGRNMTYDKLTEILSADLIQMDDVEVEEITSKMINIKNKMKEIEGGLYEQ